MNINELLQQGNERLAEREQQKREQRDAYERELKLKKDEARASVLLMLRDILPHPVVPYVVIPEDFAGFQGSGPKMLGGHVFEIVVPEIGCPVRFSLRSSGTVAKSTHGGCYQVPSGYFIKEPSLFADDYEIMWSFSDYDEHHLVGDVSLALALAKKKAEEYLPMAEVELNNMMEARKAASEADVSDYGWDKSEDPLERIAKALENIVANGLITYLP